MLKHPTEKQFARTVMSYRDACEAQGDGVECEQLPRWSNPSDFTQFGLPLGIVDGYQGAADNARVLTKHRVGVSRYRWRGCRLVDCE